MITKAFKELYTVDRISQNKGWVKVHDALKALDTEEDIQIDFTGIKVQDPWDCPEFIEILKNPKVHMLFKNKDELVNRIKMTCILNGAFPDNIVNIEVEKPREKTAEEKKIETYGEGIKQLFETDERFPGALVVDLRKKYTQLHNTASISYLKYAIDRLIEETGQTYYIVIIGKTRILDNVLDFLANVIVKYKAAGITLEVDLDNPDAETKMGLYLYKATAKGYTSMEKAKMVHKLVKDGLPGILIRYKKSRGLDDFGRYGKGEVVSSRISIIRGVEIRGKGPDRTPVVQIESYNNDYFYTRQQWMIEHDNEQLQSLRVDKLEVSLDELGFMDDFLGSSYHFLEPVPVDDTDSCKVIIAIDEDGKNVTRKCTLPERMRYVFDDWDIDYNRQLLDKYIERTKDVLANPDSIKHYKKIEITPDEEEKEPIVSPEDVAIMGEDAFTKLDDLPEFDGLDSFSDLEEME